KPCAITSFKSPIPDNSSRVAGCSVEARGASFTSPAASNSLTGIPRCASANAVTAPTGPAPAIRTGSPSMVSIPSILLQAGEADGFRPNGDVFRHHRFIFGRAVSQWVYTVLDELGLELGILDSSCNFAGDFLDNLGRRSGRCHQTVPG